MVKKKTPAKSKAKTKAKAKKRSVKTQKSNTLRRFLRWCFVLSIWGGIFLAGLLAWYGKDLSKIASSVDTDLKRVVTVYARDGKTELATYGDLRGENVRVEDLPPHIPEAFMAIEDRRFYRHFGIDLIGLARAIVVNARAGGIVQGGSTITQQLSKNLFFKPERTLKRKIQEALLALWLEWRYSKEEILSAYLNRVYFGSGAYGLTAAARVYYHKEAADLGLREAALLAGLLQAPSRLSPSHNKEGAIARMKVVLNAMVEAEFITKDMISDLDSVTIVDGEAQGMNFRKRKTNARHFTDWVHRQVQMVAGDHEGNLSVTTTIVPALQDDIVTLAKERLDSDFPEDGDKKRPEIAAILLNEDGAIRAMIGGYDYTKSQFNRATDGQRQAGSAFKPFVYLAAIEQGWRPDSMISNEKITTGRYRPGNYDGQYSEEVSLSEALAMSYNVASVHLLKEIGTRHLVDLTDRIGMNAEVREELSTALGTVDISLLDLVASYATIGQDGREVTPYGILEIKNDKGDILYRYKRRDAPRVVAYQHADALTSMMGDVVEYGTGTRAKTGFPVAGKTGTTQDYRDALFVGFSSTYTMGVWIGHDDNTSMGRVFGGTTPASIWSASMKRAHRNVKPDEITHYNADTADEIKSFISDLFSRGGSSSGRNWRREEKFEYND